MFWVIHWVDFEGERLDPGGKPNHLFDILAVNDLLDEAAESFDIAIRIIILGVKFNNKLTLNLDVVWFGVCPVSWF
jgi:hypothetical protein